MKRIVADPTRCVACLSCRWACAAVHAGTDDFRQVLELPGAKPCVYIELAAGLSVPLQCRHCEDAPCVQVCPSGALYRQSADGPVLVAAEKCFGCGFCVEACPFGVVRLAERPVGDVQAVRRVVLKCDLCADRQARGLGPACVEACPTGALKYVEIETEAQRSRRQTAAQVAASTGTKGS